MLTISLFQIQLAKGHGRKRIKAYIEIVDTKHRVLNYGEKVDILDLEKHRFFTTLAHIFHWIVIKEVVIIQNLKNEFDDAYHECAHQYAQLEEFFLNTLKRVYWADRHLLKIFPRMIAASATEGLCKVLEKHLAVTRGQVNKVEIVFELMGEKKYANKCAAIEAIANETENIIDETVEGSLTRDVGLILAAQKVQHYKIATYGMLVRLATALDRQRASVILVTILDEEKEADLVLTGLTKSNIHVEAIASVVQSSV